MEKRRLTKNDKNIIRIAESWGRKAHICNEHGAFSLQKESNICPVCGKECPEYDSSDMEKEETAEADIKKSDFEMKWREFIENKSKEYSVDDGKTLFLLVTGDDDNDVIGFVHGKSIAVIGSLCGLMQTNIFMKDIFHYSLLISFSLSSDLDSEFKEAREDNINYLAFKHEEKKYFDFSETDSANVKSDYLKEIETFVKEIAQHVSDSEKNSVLLVAMDESSHTILNVVLGKKWQIYTASASAMAESSIYYKAITMAAELFGNIPRKSE